MPLMTMTSDLSWYGNPGWTPNANAQSTDFTYNGDLTVTAIPRGFNQAGHQVSFIPKTTVDAFPIDTALGPNGSAKRKAQRGNGSLFPIGPQGQVHLFDTKRTGWYNEDRYSDTFSNKRLTGLAATYTTNSPIDDMYNRFNVRDEVHDPYGYAKPPFILRGIQREGSSNTQRWGLAGTTAGVVSGLLDIPRGGPLTTGERIRYDVERIGKFLIRPSGLAFIAKQQLLRLMSPNVEGVSGGVYKLNPQKIYNPINTLLTVAGSALGLRFRNYGLLPLGGLSRYEDIHRTRDIAQLGIIANRLVRLNDQRTGPLASQIITTWNALSGFTGPDSVGGIGFTDFKKNNAYDTYRTNDISPAAILDLTSEYDNIFPYVQTRIGIQAPGAGISPQQSVDGRDQFSLLSTYRKPSLYTLGSEGGASVYTSNTRRVFVNSLAKQLQFHTDDIFNYGSFRGSNEIYLRTHSYNIPYIGQRNDRLAPITNNTKVLTDSAGEANLRSFYSRGDENFNLKKKAEDKNFTGLPSKAPNPAKAEDQTPAIAKYKTLAYGSIPNRAGKREMLDFRTGAEYEVKSVPLSKYVNTANDKRFDLPANVDHSLIDLKIGSVDFIAYLQSFSESDSASISDLKALGIYQTYMYDSYERTVSLAFMVAARSKAELASNWKKLQSLQRLLLPNISGEKFWRPKTINLTVGDIYRGRQIILTSINFDIDTETPWEISKNQQVPYYIVVDIQATIPSTDGASFGSFGINTAKIASDILDTTTQTKTQNSLTGIDQAEKDNESTTDGVDTVPNTTNNLA
jgi:hypothetical protein